MNGKESMNNVVFKVKQASLEPIIVSIPISQLQKGQGEHLLIYVIEGRLALKVNDMHIKVEKDCLVHIPAAHMQAAFVQLLSYQVQGYIVSFHYGALQWRHEQWRLVNYDKLEKIAVYKGSSMMKMLFQTIIEINSTNSQIAEETLKKIWTMAELQQKEVTKDLKDHATSVKKSVFTVQKYMQKHLSEKIQMADLAQQAGLSVSAFYASFKRYIGMSPLQYLTFLRIFESKKILFTTELVMEDIAKAVGYEDEYYFQRVFKKIIGMAPRQYRDALKKKVLVLSPALVSDYLLLSGGYHDIFTLPGHKEHHQSLLRSIPKLNFKLSEIQRLAPDLIIGTDAIHRDYKDLCQISPTQLLSEKKQNWKQQFIEFAQLFSVEVAAASWIKIYEETVDALKKTLAESMAGKTISAASISSSGMRVFGEKRRKVSSVLYTDLQLMPPSTLLNRTVINLDTFWHIKDYPSDHLLLFADEAYEEVIDDVKAFFPGTVHIFPTEPYLTYSATGHVYLLRELRSLL
ncbi:AraC family transcriptional regulator [Bacillaceae bacterium SIJ1]|uniref:AraC family transcriptional regulator n=1 Tax=Litoribacterium kuwaitense TaxID=1398745 RepID=UPI0013EC2C46|nr:AraC family transcriptional regulator [Litoribacterium kuwaitense]NGP45310.1 AraC family transcriptional regulator [Litoribacterium kuwaitense]